AAYGLRALDRYDRELVLASVRERRRLADAEGVRALGEIVALIREELARIPDPDTADVLLCAAFGLGPSARAGLSGGQAANVLALLAAELADEADRNGRIGGELAHLADLVDGQGRVEVCTCGQPITEYEGRWLHVYNPELTGADDHEARP